MIGAASRDRPWAPVDLIASTHAPSPAGWAGAAGSARAR